MKKVELNKLDLFQIQAERLADSVPEGHTRKRIEAKSFCLWDMARLWSMGDADPADLKTGGKVIIRVKENLGTKKWPDVRELYRIAYIEKTCKSIIKCVTLEDMHDKRVRPDQILAVFMED